jgi:subtilisin-like proprotein convertase family protein
MRLLKFLFVFLFFSSIIFLYYPLRNAISWDEQSFSKEKFEIEVKVKSEKDLLYLNELGLNCTGLGKCNCLADSSQLLSLVKAGYQVRPLVKLNSSKQDRGIRQSRVSQMKLTIRDERELNLIKDLGLNCAGIGECTTVVNLEQVKLLKQNRIPYSGIKEGIKVEGASAIFKPAGSTYGRNDSAYYVPAATWTCSPITITNAPYDATVTELELTYQVYDNDCQINTIWVDLTNESVSKEYNLWFYEGYGCFISETERDTTIFDGESANQTWKLWVYDISSPGSSIILPWSITLWFSGPPVYRVNSYDYTIPEGWDSVSSPINVSANMAPADARVSSIDVHYDIIHPYNGDLDVWISDSDYSTKYKLWNWWEGSSEDDIHETKTGITEFNGELVDQTWKLWATDYFQGDQGYIDFWSITLWYQELPDLVIKSITPSNPNPMIDSIISVDMMIENQGSEDAGFFYVGLYYNLSSPPNIYTWEDEYTWVYWLNSGDSVKVTFSGITLHDTATWNMYGLADMDGDIEESDEDNNHIGPRKVKWWGVEPKPDLIISEAWVSNDCDPSLDESVHVDVVIKNIGGTSAYNTFGFYTDIFYNEDTVISPASGDDWYLSMGELLPGETEAFSFVLSNPTYAQDWKLWLLVDSDPPRITESNESNNLFGPIWVHWQQPTLKSGSISRNTIIENAMEYADVWWICPPQNNTAPEECKKWTSNYIVDLDYTGEAYKYGGNDPPWDTKDCFLYNLEHGKRAGSFATNDCIGDDVLPEPQGNPPWSTGIDCSGLVSRAWDLPYKHGTWKLLEVSAELPGGYEYLLKGDILLLPGNHTFIFDGWYKDSASTSWMWAIEAADYRPDASWTRGNHRWSIAELSIPGKVYNPYRYNNIQEAPYYDPDRAGDVNSDGNVSVSDVVFLIYFLFKQGTSPHPLWRGDANGDCQVSVSDIVYLISYIFKSGSAPYYCNSSCWYCYDYPSR